jgi:hypothetical protein
MFYVTKYPIIIIGKYIQTISLAAILKIFLIIPMIMNILNGRPMEDILYIHVQPASMDLW